MSEITKTLVEEYFEEIRKKNIINTRWEQYVKLDNKLGEIIKELREYNSFSKGLTKVEISTMCDLVVCKEVFSDKIKKTLKDEQQFSEIMEKLHAVVQEAWDFLGKIRLKYGDIQEKKIIRTSWILVISISIILAVLILFCRLLK